MNTLYHKQELSLSMQLAMCLRMPMQMIMVRGEVSLSSIYPPQSSPSE